MTPFDIFIHRLQTEQLILKPGSEQSKCHRLGLEPRPALSKDQSSYQALLDHLIAAIWERTESSPDELLNMIASELNVSGHAKLTLTNDTLSIEPYGQDVPWEIMRAALFSFVSGAGPRSELVEVPPGFTKLVGSINVAVWRLGTRPGETGWNRVIAFAGREGRSTPIASPGFLTRDLKIMEILADCYRETDGRSEVSRSVPPFLRWTTILHKSFASFFGDRVRVSMCNKEMTISSIHQLLDNGPRSNQALAEISVSLIVGWHLSERISIIPASQAGSPQGSAEFDILISGIRVFGRKVTVEVSPAGFESEVTVPLGWWWHEGAGSSKIPLEKAKAAALKEERACQPNATDLVPEFLETVLLPDDPPGRVSFVIRLRTDVGSGATYFINAVDGSIIERRQVVRS